MASRWAREATSGTTPPNRACSSTDEATASASSVCPRTMPDPGLVARGLDAQDERLVGHDAMMPGPSRRALTALLRDSLG